MLAFAAYYTSILFPCHAASGFFAMAQTTCGNVGQSVDVRKTGLHLTNKWDLIRTASFDKPSLGAALLVRGAARGFSPSIKHDNASLLGCKRCQTHSTLIHTLLSDTSATHRRKHESHLLLSWAARSPQR